MAVFGVVSGGVRGDAAFWGAHGWVGGVMVRGDFAPKCTGLHQISPIDVSLCPNMHQIAPEVRGGGDVVVRAVRCGVCSIWPVSDAGVCRVVRTDLQIC